MFEINYETSSFINSIVDIAIVVVITFIITLMFLTSKILIKNIIISKNEIILAELLDCITDNNVDDKIEKIKLILQQTTTLVNSVFTSSGNTPFLIACKFGATKIVQEMLKLGADIKYTNYEGNGPMYLAVCYMCKNMELTDASLLRTLYYCGCDINLMNKAGYTPLHLASFYGHVPLIHWLLSKGARTDIAPFPSGLALANGKLDAAYLLVMKHRQQINNINEINFDISNIFEP